MRPQKVATSFSSYPQTELQRKAQFIIQSMTGNTHFPAPLPSLATVTTAINAYSATLTALPSKANTELKKQTRDALTALLNKLALYVQVTGNGDASVYASSGFSLTKLPQRIGILPKPENFKVLPIHNSNVKLSIKKIAGADSYCFEYAPVPVPADNAWASILSTKASTVISNLNSGSQYAFRVTGVGSNPTAVYSDEVVSYVL